MWFCGIWVWFKPSLPGGLEQGGAGTPSSSDVLDVLTSHLGPSFMWLFSLKVPSGFLKPTS